MGFAKHCGKAFSVIRHVVAEQELKIRADFDALCGQQSYLTVKCNLNEIKIHDLNIVTQFI